MSCSVSILWNKKLLFDALNDKTILFKICKNFKGIITHVLNISVFCKYTLKLGPSFMDTAYKYNVGEDIYIFIVNNSKVKYLMIRFNINAIE